MSLSVIRKKKETKTQETKQKQKQDKRELRKEKIVVGMAKN